jgi:hypothetical protein
MVTKLPAQSGIAIGTGNYVVTVGLGTPKEDFTLVLTIFSSMLILYNRYCIKVL